MKKIVSLLLCFVILLCTTLPAAATDTTEPAVIESTGDNIEVTECGETEPEEIQSSETQTEATESESEATEAAEFETEATEPELEATDPTEETEDTEPAEENPEENGTVVFDEVDEWGRHMTLVEIDASDEGVNAIDGDEDITTYSGLSFSTIADAGEYLREEMKGRETSISFRWTGSTSNMSDTVTDIIHEALAHTGVPTEGDYISWNWGGYTASYTSGSSSSSLSFTMTYYTTWEQECSMTSAVTSLLDELDLSGNDYQKIKNIYTWICTNVDYDNDHLSDTSYKLQFTAYAALINKTAVCQGYAALLYRLLLTEGIDCRVIVGTSSSGNHAWNIVKLCAYYYNADTTWDATYNSSFSKYKYFLKSPSNFSNHTRVMDETIGEDYNSDEFNAAYPMASTNGKNNHSITYTCTVTPTTTSTGMLTGECSGCGGTLTVTMPKLNTDDYTYEITEEATCTATGTAAYTWNTTTYGTQTITVTLDMIAHDWDSGEITKSATCMATGIKTYTCTMCGATTTETVAIIGHDYLGGKCTMCGKEAIPITRLYNPYTYEHLLSSSDAEISALTSAGWTVDGVAWYAPDSGTPVYRLYNPYGDFHFYTIDQTEIDNLTPLGWTVDGVVMYGADSDGTPIYRLFNPYAETNYHLYTTSQDEIDTLTPQGWKLEGIAWYAVK